MTLTPIRIKGKGGQKKTWKAPDPQRVLKRQRSEDATGDGDKDGTRHRRRLRTKRLAAPIELLPSEVLERILFMSMNFNFLRSSRRIGYRFSSRSFLTGLLVDAFAPNWELWFGCPLDKIRSYYRYRWDYQRVGGDPEFQSTVLTFPWANITLILEAQQQWYRKHGAGRYFEHVDPWDFTPPSESSHPPGGFDHAKDVAACFEADWDNYTSGYDALFPGAVIGCSFIRRNLMDEPQYIEIHPWTKIPEHLLGGPLDMEKAKLLFWLIRGGARLSDTQSWELTRRGYENIMILGDSQLALHLLRLFHSLGVFREHWPAFLVEEKWEEAKRQHEYYESADQLAPATRLWLFARELLEYGS